MFEIQFSVGSFNFLKSLPKEEEEEEEEEGETEAAGKTNPADGPGRGGVASVAARPWCVGVVVALRVAVTGVAEAARGGGG